MSEPKPATTRPAPLVEHELALKTYIDALLEPPPEPEPAPVTERAVPEIEAPPQPRAPVAEPPPRPQAPPPEPVEAQPRAPEPPPWPEWAESRFDVLMFQVAGGLTLATPLAALDTIVGWKEERITHVPGHADWFLGLLPVRGRQLKVIDIAKFVIPHNHQARAALDGQRHFNHIIVIGGGRYGLACDALGEMIHLERDQVRWRRDRSQRPWLAGTVIERMCALIDPLRFIEMVEAS